MPRTSPLTRRDLLRGMATAAGLGTAPASLWAALDAGPGTRDPASPLLAWLCDAVIPDTGTPGAVAAGVPAFVALAAAHGLRGADANLVSTFSAALDVQAAGDFLKLPASNRLALLEDIDQRAYARPADTSLAAGLQGWPTLKALIIVGYYTSETGSTEELQYRLAPGRLDPDVALEPGARAWANDWTAVKFG